MIFFVSSATNLQSGSGSVFNRPDFIPLDFSLSCCFASDTIYCLEQTTDFYCPNNK